MNIESTSRIGNDNYTRPKQTFTDKLSRGDIEDKLNGYKQIEDIITVPLGSHLRYFTKQKDGKYKFRLGGFLFKNNGIPEYVIFKANSKTWSVQIKDTVFYIKMSTDEIINEYDEKIEELEDKNKALVNMVKDLKKEIKKLKK
jgi:hypothetical protein